MIETDNFFQESSFFGETRICKLCGRKVDMNLNGLSFHLALFHTLSELLKLREDLEQRGEWRDK